MENAVWAEVYERRPNEFVVTLSWKVARIYHKYMTDLKAEGLFFKREQCSIKS